MRGRSEGGICVAACADISMALWRRKYPHGSPSLGGGPRRRRGACSHISTWETSGVTDMSYLGTIGGTDNDKCQRRRGVLQLGRRRVGHLERPTMRYMFHYASFNRTLVVGRSTAS